MPEDVALNEMRSTRYLAGTPQPFGSVETVVGLLRATSEESETQRRIALIRVCFHVRIRRFEAEEAEMLYGELVSAANRLFAAGWPALFGEHIIRPALNALEAHRAGFESREVLVEISAA